MPVETSPRTDDQVMRVVADATKPGGGHEFPDGVCALYIIVHQGPVQVRDFVRRMVLAVMSRAPNDATGLNVLSRMGAGLSPTDTPVRIREVLKARTSS